CELKTSRCIGIQKQKKSSGKLRSKVYAFETGKLVKRRLFPSKVFSLQLVINLTRIFSKDGWTWMMPAISYQYPVQVKQKFRVYLSQVMLQIKYIDKLSLLPAPAAWLPWMQNVI